MMIEGQIERLESAVELLLLAVEFLEEDAFLAPINGWTPRDIVAHLIGWNRHVIEGSLEIARGELPYYDVDPGENYAKINAALVRHHPSRDREELACQLRASAEELASFLRNLDADVWACDHGVRHDGAIVTIEGTVDELIADYAHHQKQLEALAERGHEPQ